MRLVGKFGYQVVPQLRSLEGKKRFPHFLLPMVSLSSDWELICRKMSFRDEASGKIWFSGFIPITKS